jgi:hypothetical protein
MEPSAQAYAQILSELKDLSFRDIEQFYESIEETIDDESERNNPD